MTTSLPDVFIIESLTRDDETKDRFEGRRIRDMLAMSDKSCRYVYVRTVRELKKVACEFKESNYRYLHISAHGNNRSIGLTYDSLDFGELGVILRPNIRKRRVFVSACRVMNIGLAGSLMHDDEGALSVMGPTVKLRFNDAAMLWASFYHLAFKLNGKGMNTDGITKCARNVAAMYEVPLRFYSRAKANKKPESRSFGPNRSNSD